MNFARATAALPVDRRAAPRIRVSTTARLRTSFAHYHGELWDLSTTGARFVIENPPKEGIAALLEWDGRDVLCRIIWSGEGMSGLQFEKPISRALVDDCVMPVAKSEAAALGNIPLGKRRSLLPGSESARDDSSVGP
jgi:hypothetical protein